MILFECYTRSHDFTGELKVTEKTIFMLNGSITESELTAYLSEIEQEIRASVTVNEDT